MSEESYRSVFDILVKNRSLPFLQLSTLSGMNEEQLREIVDELERRNMVSVTDKGDSFNEIVTVRERAFAAGRGLKD